MELQTLAKQMLAEIAKAKDFITAPTLQSHREYMDKEMANHIADNTDILPPDHPDMLIMPALYATEAYLVAEALRYAAILEENKK